MLYRTITGCLCLTAAVWGCSDSSPDSQPTAPLFPPAASMQIDLGPFNESAAPSLGEVRPDPRGPEAAPATSLNFANAALRVTVVNVALLVSLSPPAAALAAALSTEPTYTPEDGFLWVYTWNNGDTDQEVRLYAKPNGAVIDWELYLSLFESEPQLWFYGRSLNGRESAEDEDAGFWVFTGLFHEGDSETVRLDWNVVPPGQASLNVENIEQGSLGYQDILHYAVNDPAAALDFYDASADATWDVQWTGDGSGSIRAPDYNDGERACWDTEQMDAVCPSPPQAF